MTDKIDTTPHQPEQNPNDNNRWPPERPAEIPLSDKEIKATEKTLKTALQKRKVAPRTKTLADYPEVARYYRPEFNGGIPASTIPCFLDVTVIWCCKAVPGETYIWAAMPQNFTRTVLKHLSDPPRSALGPVEVPEPTVARSLPRFHQLKATGLSPTRGCPGCSGRMATTGNNLELALPEVIEFWDHETSAYGPESCLPHSVHEVYWRDAGLRPAHTGVDRFPHPVQPHRHQPAGLRARGQRDQQPCPPPYPGRRAAGFGRGRLASGLAADLAPLQPQDDLAL